MVRAGALLGVCLGLVLAGCASAPLERSADFARADSNRDGRVSLPEWLQFGGGEAAFLALDRERRGYLEEVGFREALRLSDQATQVTERQQENIDDGLSRQVKAALAGNRDLNSWNFRIETYQRNVTLSGAVRTPREKQLAEDVARSVSGVANVFNQIVIRQ